MNSVCIVPVCVCASSFYSAKESDSESERKHMNEMHGKSIIKQAKLIKANAIKTQLQCNHKPARGREVGSGGALCDYTCVD